MHEDFGKLIFRSNKNGSMSLYCSPTNLPFVPPQQLRRFSQRGTGFNIPVRNPRPLLSSIVLQWYGRLDHL